MPIKVSVIVPVHETGPDIEGDIDSMLKQTLPGVERSPVAWRRTAGRVHLQFPKRLKDFAPGVYALGVVFDGSTGPAAALGKAEVAGGGRLTLEGGFREADPEVKAAVAAGGRPNGSNGPCRGA
jgi:hypothetical protein